MERVLGGAELPGNRQQVPGREKEWESKKKAGKARKGNRLVAVRLEDPLKDDEDKTRRCAQGSMEGAGSHNRQRSEWDLFGAETSQGTRRREAGSGVDTETPTMSQRHIVL